jgi:CRISPR/Cas system CSM-associated protein Csm3 (group 7 of RAMP superfamily)
MSYRDRDRGGPREAPLPKPYKFVPLPQRRPQLQAPAGHHRYGAELLSGRLDAVIIARTPVHVASGLLETSSDRTYPLVKAHFRSQGRPVIPGTSLKGCIRSIVEAISPSAVHVTHMRDLSRDYQPMRNVERLDVTQRLFGAQGYQGAVSFSDAVLAAGETVIQPSVQLFRPRPKSVSTYSDGNRPKGRKFYRHGKPAEGNLPLEACPVDSRFALRMHFSNLSTAELGLLLAALGLGEPRLWPKLGGAKPACLGTIEISAATLSIDETAASYRDFDSAAADREIAPLVDSARSAGLLLDEQFKTLADILRWPNEESCPDRMY